MAGEGGDPGRPGDRARDRGERGHDGEQRGERAELPHRIGDDRDDGGVFGHPGIEVPEDHLAQAVDRVGEPLPGLRPVRRQVRRRLERGRAPGGPLPVFVEQRPALGAHRRQLRAGRVSDGLGAVPGGGHRLGRREQRPAGRHAAQRGLGGEVRAPRRHGGLLLEGPGPGLEGIEIRRPAEQGGPGPVVGLPRVANGGQQGTRGGEERIGRGTAPPGGRPGRGAEQILRLDQGGDRSPGDGRDLPDGIRSARRGIEAECGVGLAHRGRAHRGRPRPPGNTGVAPRATSTSVVA